MLEPTAPVLVLVETRKIAPLAGPGPTPTAANHQNIATITRRVSVATVVKTDIATHVWIVVETVIACRIME